MNADRHVGKSPLADRELLGRRVRSWCEGEPGYAASHAHRYTRKDPNLHRVIWFMQETEDGQLVEFGLLRSLLWMEENGAYQEGDRVAIDQPEMGVPGLAQILRIDRCPDLEEGPGCLVTGWYRHSHGEIWEVVLEGGETIETTAQHPFWSADRLAFVPACELQKNEHLSGREGLVEVLSVRKRPGFEPVYNIEVEGDHCYRVGKQGLLVHNASAPSPCDGYGIKPGQMSYLAPPLESLLRNPFGGPSEFKYLKVISLVANLQKIGSAGAREPDDFTKLLFWKSSRTMSVTIGSDTIPPYPGRLGLDTDTVGHIVGNQFGGYANRTMGIGNIFPQNATQNNSGKYNMLEQMWAKLLPLITAASSGPQCPEICVQWMFNYKDPDTKLWARPTQLYISWWLNGTLQPNESVWNPH